MATNLYVNMTTENEEFLMKWKNEKDKKQQRISVPNDVFDFVSERAFKDFGIIQSAFSMEVVKLLLIAKETIEKQESQ